LPNLLACFWPMAIAKSLCQLPETLMLPWRSHPMKKSPYPPYTKD
jgi:hypothetical protein